MHELRGAIPELLAEIGSDDRLGSASSPPHTIVCVSELNLSPGRQTHRGGLSSRAKRGWACSHDRQAGAGRGVGSLKPDSCPQAREARLWGESVGHTQVSRLLDTLSLQDNRPPLCFVFSNCGRQTP